MKERRGDRRGGKGRQSGQWDMNMDREWGWAESPQNCLPKLLAKTHIVSLACGLGSQLVGVRAVDGLLRSPRCQLRL